jgi:hypothetical protein
MPKDLARSAYLKVISGDPGNIGHLGPKILAAAGKYALTTGRPMYDLSPYLNTPKNQSPIPRPK